MLPRNSLSLLHPSPQSLSAQDRDSDKYEKNVKTSFKKEIRFFFFFLSSHNLLGEKNNSTNKGQIPSSSSSQKHLKVATEHNETKWEIITTSIFAGFAPVNPTNGHEVYQTMLFCQCFRE